jgi:hypothetical protein
VISQPARCHQPQGASAIRHVRFLALSFRPEPINIYYLSLLLALRKQVSFCDFSLSLSRSLALE